MTTITRPKDMTTAEKRVWRSEQLRLLRMEIRMRKGSNGNDPAT